MSLLESVDVPLNTVAPDFQLKGVDENVYSLDDFKERSILVIIFMCNHCPYVQACIERLVTLQRDFIDRGVRFIGINANDAFDFPEDDFEAMKVFAREKNMNFPYLRDETQYVAKAYKAVCTPDVFVYDDQRALRYHGRIDNNWKDATKVTSQDLRSALEAMISQKKVDSFQIPSMGCSIKWKQ